MTGDVCLIIGQMYDRVLSFRSGMMVCQSQVVGASLPLREALARFTSKDILSNGLTNLAVDVFLKAINISCRALGHT